MCIRDRYDMSGNYMERIGKTISINPGNNRMVLIDLGSPENARLIEFNV